MRKKKNHCRQKFAQINFEPDDSLAEGTSLGWDSFAAILKLTNLKEHISTGLYSSL